MVCMVAGWIWICLGPFHTSKGASSFQTAMSECLASSQAHSDTVPRRNIRDTVPAKCYSQRTYVVFR